MASGMTPADDTADAPRFPIVGLGASAGGLEALEQFLKALPADTGLLVSSLPSAQALSEVCDGLAARLGVRALRPC